MDIQLHDIERGCGTPLILLHGNGESSDYFKHQLDFFSSDYRVIAVDTRGHGASPRGEKPFTLTQFAEDLKDFMNERSIPKAHILGFSDGGNIALLFALRYPQMVDRLILNGANLNTKGVRPYVQIPICMGYGIVSLFALFSSNAKKKKEILGLMVTQPHIDSSSLGTLHMPVLVIAGTKDIIKDSHTRQIAASFPNAQLCILEGGHSIASRNHEAFNRRILEFLN